MLVAFCDQVSGNSTPRCSNAGFSGSPITASRISHSMASNGCTPGSVNLRWSPTPPRVWVWSEVVVGVCGMGSLLSVLRAFKPLFEGGDNATTSSGRHRGNRCKTRTSEERQAAEVIVELAARQNAVPHGLKRRKYRLREALGAPAHEPRDRPRRARAATAMPAATRRAISAPGVSLVDGRRGGHQRAARRGRSRRRARRAFGAGGSRTAFFFLMPAARARRACRRRRAPAPRLVIGLGCGAAPDPHCVWAEESASPKPGRVLLDVGRDLLAGVVDLVGPVAAVELAVGLVVAEDLLEVVGRRARRERERREHDAASGVGAPASRPRG